MKPFKSRPTYYLKPIDDKLKSTYKLKQMNETFQTRTI